MKTAFVTLEVAEMIMHMASVCYSEGLVGDGEWELCQEVIRHYPLVGEKWFREMLEEVDA